jgi:cytochrome oxidase Cu insertion factor (SCO1/SenC/PrrC family)
MIREQFGNPEFWMALIVGAGAVAIFLYWLSTGARQRNKQEDSMLSEGSKAPDFKLPDDSGGQVQLSAYKGKKSVVLFFYPKADTPG